MTAYATIYPWAAMFLSVLAATMCVVGGGVTSLAIWRMEVNPNTGDSKIGNIFFGCFTFVLCCLGAQLCLYIGGKAVGAF